MVVVDGRAHDGEIVDDGRRGGHVIPAGIVSGNVAKADLPVLAEIGAGSAGRGVHRDEAGILCGLEDPSVARLLRRAGGIEPSGSAAIDQTVAVIAVQINLWVVGPARFTDFRVERDDTVESGG